MIIKIREVHKDQSKIISLGESDLIRLYRLWKNINIKNGDLIENIIKVPLAKEKSIISLATGIQYENKRWLALLTTPGLMKNQTENTKGEYLFINEEDKEFINFMENIASLGKIEKKYNTKLCINKDIIARLGLLASAGERVYLPNFKKAVLPEMVYTYISNYLQFKEVDGILDLDNFELTKHENLEVEHVAMDGSGFMMPDVADEIGKQLRIDYRLDFVGVREVGTATKGLIVRFDWKKFLKEEHSLEELIVKDMWGNDVNLFDVDLVMNESQVKWGKWFDSLDEIEELKAKYESKYNFILNGFTITGFNKKKANDYSLTNYQIISNLCLTPNELNKLSKETEDIYKKAIDKDIDAVRILLGDIAREEMDELGASTKIHKLLQLDESLISCQTAKRCIDNMLNKKVHELAGGRLYVKGNYKVVCKDPISYFESLIDVKYTDKNKIKGSITQNGLKAKTNFIAGEVGNRTLARCPLNSATEILKTTLSNSKMHNKYLNLSNEIIFYAFDHNMMLQSGEDEDKDISMVIDNNVIYNAVIEDIDNEGKQWYFRNQFDGDNEEIEFRKYNMYTAVIDTVGDSIGALSNTGAKISNLIQEMPFKYSDLNIIKTYTELNESSVDMTNDEFKSFMKNGLNNKKILSYTDIKETEIKNTILRNFQKYKKYSYYTLYLQMVAIDSVKTMKKVTKEEKSLLKEFTKKKKPVYIYHAKYSKENKVVNYEDTSWSNTLLNNFSQRVNTELGYLARKNTEQDYDNKYLFNAMFRKLTANEDKIKKNEFNPELVEKLRLIEQEYHDLRNNVNATLSDEKINEEKNKIDILILSKVDKIREEYDYKEILNAACKVRRKIISKEGNERLVKICSRFIIMFIFEELVKHLRSQNLGVGTVYKEVEDDEDFKYFFKKWKKVTISLADENLTEKEMSKKMIKLGQAKKIRMNGLTDNELTKEIIIKDAKVYNTDEKELGTLFKEFMIDNGRYSVHSTELAKTKKSMTINIAV